MAAGDGIGAVGTATLFVSLRSVDMRMLVDLAREHEMPANEFVTEIVEAYLAEHRLQRMEVIYCHECGHQNPVPMNSGFAVWRCCECLAELEFDERDYERRSDDSDRQGHDEPALAGS